LGYNRFQLAVRLEKSGRRNHPAKIRHDPISHKTPCPKFTDQSERIIAMNAAENLANFGTQTEIAKSMKAVLIRRIARLVRQEGLDYEGWRYVAKKVRQLCRLKPDRKGRKLPNVLTAEQFRRFYHEVTRHQGCVSHPTLPLPGIFKFMYRLRRPGLAAASRLHSFQSVWSLGTNLPPLAHCCARVSRLRARSLRTPFFAPT
jgi:hypothetical protein